MGGSSPPPNDPRAGEAALLSAQTGQEALDWMKEQAQITNAWAEEDRARYKGVFEPLQDEVIAEAQTWDSPQRRQARADQAAADVTLAGAQQQTARQRQAMAMGVNPASGRFANAEVKAGQGTALQSAGARNLARRSVETEGVNRRAAAAGLGSGLQVNPGTSIGLSNSAVAGGTSAAQQGYGQQAQILNQQSQNEYNAWAANQQGLWSALGIGVGAMPWATIFSSKDAKTDKAPARGVLEAVEGLDVETWRYKEGMGPKGLHVGPYAEDFQRETGSGDGKTINLADATGLALGAIKELSAKVDKVAEKVAPRGVMEAL